jgi:hypothetical protein
VSGKERAVEKKQPTKGQGKGKSLTLHKETLRFLESPELMRAAGGITIVNSCNTGCGTNGACCHWT